MEKNTSNKKAEKRDPIVGLLEYGLPFLGAFVALVAYFYFREINTNPIKVTETPTVILLSPSYTPTPIATPTFDLTQAWQFINSTSTQSALLTLTPQLPTSTSFADLGLTTTALLGGTDTPELNITSIGTETPSITLIPTQNP